MAGLVLDIFVGFILRWLVIAWRNVESLDWPTVSGTIVRCYFEKRGYGGDYVVLQYKYKSNWERFHGEIRKPFIYPNYADAFVRHHPVDSEIAVRVSPKESARSFPIIDR